MPYRTNEDICRLWAMPNSDHQASNRSMRVDGPWLISYDTAIGYRDDSASIYILSEDTFSTTTAKQLCWAHRACRPGQTVTLPVFRYGKTRPFSSAEQAAKDAAQVIIDRFDDEVKHFDTLRNQHHKLFSLTRAARHLTDYETLSRRLELPPLPDKARRTYKHMVKDLAAKLMAVRLEGDRRFASLANLVG